MPPVTMQNAAPSTLSDVLRHVVDVFSSVGDPTPVQIGKRYLEDFGAATSQRVLFVQHRRSKVGPPIEMGNAFSVIAGCDVAVRGAEDGSDLGRFDTAEALLARVGDYIGVATSGRVEWADLADDSPLATDAIGADFAFAFSYHYDVRHDPKRWALAPATTDTAPPFSPTAPQAIAGTEPTSITATTVPQP